LKPQGRSRTNEDQTLQLGVLEPAHDVIKKETSTTQAVDRMENGEIDAAQVGYESVHHERLPSGPARCQVHPERIDDRPAGKFRATKSAT